MNNLKLTLLVFGTSSALFVAGQTLQRRIQTGNAALGEKITRLSDENVSLKDQLSSLRIAVVATNQFGGRLNSQLNAPRLEAIPPLDPDNEGIWPANKPYFYLAKSALGHANFQQFQGSPSGLKITADCATVLGMNPEEATTVDSKFEQLVIEFKRVEFESLQRCPTTLPGKYPGEKISYRIPPLRDAMTGPLQIFSNEVAGLLGTSRSELFLDWAKLCIGESLSDFGTKGRTFTFTEDPYRSKHHLTRLQIADEDGKFVHYGEIWTPPHDEFPPGFPEEMRPRFPWRHLFGENAERRADPWRIS